MKDLTFLPKMTQEFKNLKTINLSNCDLRSKNSVMQVCQMIDQNDSIETLILKNCKLNGSGLLLLADVLTKTTSPPITRLDITEN